MKKIIGICLLLSTLSLASMQNTAENKKLNSWDSFSVKVYCGFNELFNLENEFCKNRAEFKTDTEILENNNSKEASSTVNVIERIIVKEYAKYNPASDTYTLNNIIKEYLKNNPSYGVGGSKEDTVYSQSGVYGFANASTSYPIYAGNYGGSYVAQNPVYANQNNGISTIGYLNGATIEKSTINDSIFNNVDIRSGNATLTSAVIANASITNATTSNLFANVFNAINSFFTNLGFINATGTNLVATGTASLATANISTSTVNNLFATSSIFVDATSTNLFANIFNSVKSVFTELLFTNATGTNLIVTGSTTLATTTVSGDTNFTATTTIDNIRIKIGGQYYCPNIISITDTSSSSVITTYDNIIQLSVCN